MRSRGHCLFFHFVDHFQNMHCRRYPARLELRSDKDSVSPFGFYKTVSVLFKNPLSSLKLMHISKIVKIISAKYIWDHTLIATIARCEQTDGLDWASKTALTLRTPSGFLTVSEIRVKEPALGEFSQDLVKLSTRRWVADRRNDS